MTKKIIIHKLEVLYRTMDSRCTAIGATSNKIMQGVLDKGLEYFMSSME